MLLLKSCTSANIAVPHWSCQLVVLLGTTNACLTSCQEPIADTSTSMDVCVELLNSTGGGYEEDYTKCVNRIARRNDDENDDKYDGKTKMLMNMMRRIS